VLRIVDVIHIVMHFGSEVDVLIVPGNIVSGTEILLRRRLVAMVSQPIDRGIVPWSALDPIDVPDSIVERKFLPVRQVAIDTGSPFKTRDKHGIAVGPIVPRSAPGKEKQQY
jgi:hypothetical protein